MSVRQFKPDADDDVGWWAMMSRCWGIRKDGRRCKQKCRSWDSPDRGLVLYNTCDTHMDQEEEATARAQGK